MGSRFTALESRVFFVFFFPRASSQPSVSTDSESLCKFWTDVAWSDGSRVDDASATA